MRTLRKMRDELQIFIAYAIATTLVLGGAFIVLNFVIHLAKHVIKQLT